jgi:hypothetical protein
MSDIKHTPGPWTMTRAHLPYLILDAFGGLVADTYDEADARLIAAAPELLEALEYAFNIYGRFGAVVNEPHKPGEWIEQARAAIAKAQREGV